MGRTTKEGKGKLRKGKKNNEWKGKRGKRGEKGNDKAVYATLVWAGRLLFNAVYK